MYESITAVANRRQILGSFRVWSLAGETSAAILGGFLVMFSFDAVLWGQVVFGWFPFIFSLFLIEPPRPQMTGSSNTMRILKIVAQVLIDDRLTRLVFINYVVWGLASFCVVWLLQEYWTNAGIPLSYFGALWAVLMAFSAVVSKFAHSVEHRLGPARTLTTLASAPILGYLLMAYAPPVVGVAAGSLFYLTRGLTYVVFQDAFNIRIPSEFRATANSLQSLCFRLGFVPIGPVIGSIVDTRGMPTALAGLAAAFCTCAIFLLLPLLKEIDEIYETSPSV